ncbi:MAG: DUF2292 domain-containing protein [Candidatus Acidiferrales bacterium]|jgi:hypothetical protein
MTKNDTTIQESLAQSPRIASDSSSAELEAALMKSGPEAIRELIHGLQTIRYGSIVLTVHDGRLVEITKTMKVRPSVPNDKE